MTEYLDNLFAGAVWQQVYIGNTLADYVIALCILVAVAVVVKLIERGVVVHLRKLSERTETDIDDLLVKVGGSIRGWFFVVLGLYTGLRYLSFSSSADKTLTILLLLAIVYQVIRSVDVVIRYIVRKAAGLAEDESNAGALRFVAGIAKFVLWILGLLLILQNAGVNVTSLIAGLGIGGIAIAFAVQGILEDLFASFSIFFDKPFEVGDTIRAGEHFGEVERIGIKTTRLRSPEGEEIIIANKDLTSERVHNFKRLDERRITLAFGVLYETPQEKLEQIPALVQEIIERTDGVRPQRAHFTGFGDSALDFTVTYFVESDEYDVYLDKQQEVNLALHKRFAQEGIEMAYPTRTVYLSK